MKKNKSFIIIVVGFGIIILLFLASCNDYLNLSPRSEITDRSFWKTSHDFELAANWFYSNSLTGPNTNDNRSDIAIGIQPDAISSGTNTPPVNSTLWSDPYSAIRNANELIEKAKNSPIKDQVLTYLGEGYFFRAYNYFKLFKNYGGVPIITNVLNPSNKKEIFQSRASRDKTIRFILNDLDHAIQYLETNSKAGKGRICREAAEAYKARVCLFAGTWREFHKTGDPDSLLNLAVKSSKSVIDSHVYRLYDAKGINSYRYSFIDNTSENNPGSIISIKYRFGINPNDDWEYGISWGEMSPTKKLADMYLCTDGLPITKSSLFNGYNSCISEFENRDPRMRETFIVPGTQITRPQYATPTPQWPGVGNNRNVNSGYMLYKFVSEIASPRNSSASDFNWNVLRYAEVLLTYAEAKLELDGYISDADLNISINRLRDRVGISHLTNEFVNVHNLNMRTEIRRERTVELALEGFRWDDLRRWNIAVEELSKPLLSIKVIGTQWNSSTVTINGNSTPGIFYNLPANRFKNGFLILQPASQRLFSKKNYLLPIPTKQIALNPNLVQNTGW